jgi:hypothetical protein
MRIGLAPFLAPSLALVAFLAAGSPSQAEDDPPQPPSKLLLRTERAVVFKDGYALFVRKGTARADEQGHVYTDEVPDAAVLGSFWAFSEEDALLGLEARFVEATHTRTEEAACLTVLDLLRANQGRRLTLGLPDGTEVAGVLEAVLERPAPEPEFTRSTSAQPPVEAEVSPFGGALLVMADTPRGRVVRPVSDVRSIAGQSIETRMTRTFRSRAVTKQLRFSFGAERAGENVAVRLLFFAPGLRWIPTYRVGGALRTEADLALQAEVLNEAEDLTDVALDLVVGVPNFRFREVISPLSLEAQLRNALAQAAPQLMGQISQASNIAFRTRGGERFQPEGPAGDIAPELARESNQDLFVYAIPGFTLAKGGRATVPLWQSTVPMSHLYALEVTIGRNVDGGGSYVRARDSNQAVAPLALAKHHVWHYLELTNRGNVPWTTGAALTLQGTVPIGQDLLTYTPVGGRSLLPLTVAVDVRADYSEVEVAREPKAVRHSGEDYARIRKRAAIRATNYRGEAVPFRASLSLGGRVEVASDDAVVRINDYRPEDWSHPHYARLNHHSDVEWNVTLGAGETRELACEYEFYLK